MGTCVCPCSPWRVVMAARLARAIDTVVTYSQVGSRGLPWTSVTPASSRRRGRASSHSRVAGVIVSRVHSIAARASGLNQSISVPPVAAPS